MHSSADLQPVPFNHHPLVICNPSFICQPLKSVNTLVGFFLCQLFSHLNTPDPINSDRNSAYASLNPQRCPQPHVRTHSSRCVPTGRTFTLLIKAGAQAVRILWNSHSAYHVIHASRFCFRKYNLHVIDVLIQPGAKKGGQEVSPKIEDMAEKSLYN